MLMMNVTSTVTSTGWSTGSIGLFALLPIVLFLLILIISGIAWKYKLFKTMFTGVAVFAVIGFVLLCGGIIWGIANAGAEGLENGDPWILYLFGFAVLLWVVGAIVEHLGWSWDDKPKRKRR